MMYRKSSEKGSALPLGNIILATLAAIALISVVWYFGGPRGTSQEKNISALSQKNGINERAEISIGDSPSLGRRDARVAIVEFADYQCPFCAVLHAGAEVAIMDEYVKKGKATLTFKHYPFFGDESVRAASASKCADEQGKFWEFHDALFERRMQSVDENIGIFSTENLITISGGVGLNEKMFTACLTSGKYTQAVLDEMEEGRQAGVVSTPTIFINGRKTEGSLAFDVYKTIIDEELSR
ncbi:MAG: DsbA family protein [Candidatus Azambacteria bacterium]|nr:DsbA family protein [Candidatus Azambacteria bacterium]